MVQNIIVILILLAAVVYMVRKIYRSLKGKDGCQCGCCSNCSSLQNQAKKQSECMKNEGKDDCCCKKD